MRTILIAAMFASVAGAAVGQPAVTVPYHAVIMPAPQSAWGETYKPLIPRPGLLIENGSPVGIVPQITKQFPRLILSTNGHEITIDLDKGTVDLGGVKLDDAAKAFWEAVQTIAGRSVKAAEAAPNCSTMYTTNPPQFPSGCGPAAARQTRAYTFGEIDRMRKAISDGPMFSELIVGLVKSHPNDYEIFYRELVEARLQTAIIAGFSPDDLERKAAGR